MSDDRETQHIYIVPEFALTAEEGRAALATLLPALEQGNPVALDMVGCHVLCTHWVSGFFSPLLDVYPIEEVAAAVHVWGASPTNQRAIDLMYESARAHAILDGRGY